MTLNELFLEYDIKRNRSNALAEHRKSQLLAENPRLAELIAEKEAVCLKQLEDTMLQPRNRAEIAKQAQEKLAELDEQIARCASAEELQQITPQYECEICKDTGHDDRGAKRRLCSCMMKRIFRELYGAVPVEELKGCFGEYDTGVFHTSEQQRQAKAVKQLAKQYAENSARKPILMFMGSAGLGKSYTMSCIAKELAKQKENILFIGAFSLFSVFHQSRLGSGVPLEPIYDADVLLIDDLGTEPMTANVTLEYLFRLLEHRIRRNLPTIISTNMNAAQLKERYTEKVTSRLFAENTASVLRLAGEDIRLNG